jgi:hypothetical protein
MRAIWRWVGLPALIGALRAAELVPAPQAFRQEVAVISELTNGLPAGPVQLLDAPPTGPVRAFTGGRWFVWRAPRWEALPELTPAGPEQFAFADAAGQPVRAALPWAEVRQVLRAQTETWLVTARAPFRVRAGQLTSAGWPGRFSVAQAALAPAGRLWVASSGGLLLETDEGWAPQGVTDGLGRAWAVQDVLGVAFDPAGQPWFATKAGAGFRAAAGSWRFFEGKDGLPWNDFTGIAAGPDGAVWFGTRLGAIRWDGTGFHYRQGRRWLPHDDVRQVAVAADGAAWLATAGGVGRIEFQATTLAAKAEHYEGEIERYVARTPFGYVSEARLREPGVRAGAAPDDSDNDGLWTAMYGAGECFAYGATRDPRARARATKAFRALQFLQEVTQGGTPAPDRGYVARTIRPVTLPDPNAGRLEQDRATRAAHDRLWKVYAPRWPKSADGQWYWKSDTSSDELDGHYFFYPLYHDLVAETPAEKAAVRTVVRELTDHLVTHGFRLVDHDGTVTRWGGYAPTNLNHDFNWWPERGLNSLSILSYLAVAAHVTGDAKYDAAARELIERHGYAQNLMFPKVQFGPGSGNQSDDEMAYMCFYNLLRYSKDAALKTRGRAAFFHYWPNDAPELNPFFNFAYAAHARGGTGSHPWGDYPLDPWAGWHEDALATLRGFPLDRLNWGHRNSHRLDVRPLARQAARDLTEGRNDGRGALVSGRVLPVENRHFNHWNTDPWQLDYGGAGDELAAGTVFLLPYHLGLYHGFIAKP